MAKVPSPTGQPSKMKPAAEAFDRGSAKGGHRQPVAPDMPGVKRNHVDVGVLGGAVARKIKQRSKVAEDL